MHILISYQDDLISTMHVTSVLIAIKSWPNPTHLSLVSWDSGQEVSVMLHIFSTQTCSFTGTFSTSKLQAFLRGHSSSLLSCFQSVVLAKVLCAMNVLHKTWWLLFTHVQNVQLIFFFLFINLTEHLNCILYIPRLFFSLQRPMSLFFNVFFGTKGALVHVHLPTCIL